MTYTNLLRATAPCVGMVLISSCYHLVDGFFIANFAGTNAFAAVSLVIPIFAALASLAFMLGSGGCALVSYHLGKGEKQRAQQIFSMIMEVLLAVAFLCALSCYYYLPEIVDALGADATIRADAITYGAISLLAIPFSLLFTCLEPFWGAANLQDTGALLTILSGICNAIGAFLLVYYWKLGIWGAAVASGATQVLFALLAISYFLREKSTLRFSFTHWELSPLVKACTNGLSELLGSISVAVVTVLYNLQLIKLTGTEGVAAFGVIAQIAMIFQSVYFGYALGINPLVGYNYGAGNTLELRLILQRSHRILVCFALTLIAIMELCSSSLVSIYFDAGTALHTLTTGGFRLYTLSFLLSGYNLFYSGFFTGLNNGLISGVISFARTMVFEVAAVLLLPLYYGLTGIWCAISVAECCSFCFCRYLLRRYKSHYGY